MTVSSSHQVLVNVSNAELCIVNVTSNSERFIDNEELYFVEDKYEIYDHVEDSIVC